MKKLFILYILLVTGCAAGPPLGERYSESYEQLEGFAKIYLYRPASIGAVWYPKVFINNNEVVHLTAGGYTYFFVKPGVHHVKGIQADIFGTNEESNYNIVLNVSEIKDYYLKFYFSETGSKLNISHIGGGNITPYSESTGEFIFREVNDSEITKDELAKSRYLKPLIKVCNQC